MQLLIQGRGDLHRPQAGLGRIRPPSQVGAARARSPDSLRAAWAKLPIAGEGPCTGRRVPAGASHASALMVEQRRKGIVQRRGIRRLGEAGPTVAARGAGAGLRHELREIGAQPAFAFSKSAAHPLEPPPEDAAGVKAKPCGLTRPVRIGVTLPVFGSICTSSFFEAISA